MALCEWLQLAIYDGYQGVITILEFVYYCAVCPDVRSEHELSVLPNETLHLWPSDAYGDRNTLRQATSQDRLGQRTPVVQALVVCIYY
jgi:hypothetical protein